MLKSNTLLQNRYLIIRLLAQGGMGAVYEAVDQRLNNTVALKETFFTDEDMRRAFHREAALLATLRHPALPKVIDHFTEGEGQFLVMEYIGGDDLARLLKLSGKPIPLRDVLVWADQLLGVLDYLHQQRQPIIHRDIKPQNLKLNERGEIILLDFGLAKEATLGSGIANPSVRGYTLVYAPIEQIQGTGTDPRSDLYSAAATLYHLMTGITPADALARATSFIQGQPDPLRPANEINPRIPPAIAAVLEQALSQDRNRRPATAGAFREQLRSAPLQNGVVAQTPPPAQPTVPPTPLFHSHPQPATPLNRATEPQAGGPTFQNPTPSTAPTAAPPPLPALDFSMPGKPKSSKAKLFILLGAGAALLIGALLFAAIILPRLRNTGPGETNLSGETKPESLSAATALRSRDLFLEGEGARDAQFYFDAEPGELKLTLNVIGSGATVTVEAFDEQKKELPFTAGNLIVASSGSNEQQQARLLVNQKKRIVLSIKSPYPESLKAMRLRITGPARLEETATNSPLNALFADRDNPKPLGYDTIYGAQATPKEMYYSFTSGAGQLKFTMNVIARGTTVDVELFDENGARLSFAEGSSTFSLASSGHDEQKSDKVTIASRQKLLMRVRNNYPETLQAYRLKLEGPVESVSPGGGDGSQSMATVFAARDNPLPLNNFTLSSTGLDRDYYYQLRVGPGIVTFELEVEGNGATVTVELFNAAGKPVPFGNGTQFSVSSSGKQERQKAEINFGAEERLLLRLSNTYPESMKNYRLKIDGEVKKATGE